MPARDPVGFRENLVLVAQKSAFVCLNRYPFTSSHLLVAPRRHVTELEELSESEYAALMNLVRAAVSRLRAVVGAQAFNVGLNLGLAAGASIVGHLHAHVVPRWEGDTSFMPVLADVRIMSEYLDQTWMRLHTAFADLQEE
jgi:ATP adenylyltransferase